MQIGIALFVLFSSQQVAGWSYSTPHHFLFRHMSSFSRHNECERVSLSKLSHRKDRDSLDDDHAYSSETTEIPSTTTLMMDRRQTLQKLVATTAATIMATTSHSQMARARNLPLSTGADTSNTGTVDTLIPIVRMRQAIARLQDETTTRSTTTVSTIQLPSPSVVPRDELQFKKVLDAYSDPISYKQKFVDQNAFLVYYTKGFDGPGRPSIEDDLPVKQTLQYGARNDAWVAWEESLIEWEYAAKEGVFFDNKDDILQPLKRTLQALDVYLGLAPPEDLAIAQKQVS